MVLFLLVLEHRVVLERVRLLLVVDPMVQLADWCRLAEQAEV